MTCQEFWASEGTGGALQSHLDECAACASGVRRHDRLRAGLRELSAEMAAVQAPPRIEARLVREFRRQSVPGRAARVNPGWWRSASWAAAAVTVVTGALMIGGRVPQGRPAEVVVDNISLETPWRDGFVPLPGAVQVGSTDDLSVLHVELPRSAMMQVGIEVSPDRAGETVQADVMVGPDGLARAVRFVDSAGTD